MITHYLIIFGIVLLVYEQHTWPVISTNGWWKCQSQDHSTLHAGKRPIHCCVHIKGNKL